MNTREAIDESIEHHERMSAWVEEMTDKEKGQKSTWEVMDDAIGEVWGDTDCALCRKFYPLDCEGGPNTCPLAMKYGKCTKSPRNAWRRLDQTKTWKGWLYHDRRLIKQLKSL